VKFDPAQLQVIVYPDPRLKKAAAPVTRFDGDLERLVRRMFALMHEHKGVGLAAPQVAVPLRLFVMNSGEEGAPDRVLINPEIADAHGAKESEEGCLSIPDIRVQIRRATWARVRARDLTGQAFELEGADLVARIWQHEIDHLDGILITDRMGASDRIATRKALKELEGQFKAGT
jgi:peptide deformylase